MSAIGAKLPVATSEEARQQWMCRQLCNDTEDTLQLFRPLAESLLTGLAGRSVRLILDPTDLAVDLTIVQITLAYRGRALPLAWLTTYIEPDTVKDAIRLLFSEIRSWLPKEARVYLICDREFHGYQIAGVGDQQFGDCVIDVCSASGYRQGCGIAAHPIGKGERRSVCYQPNRLSGTRSGLYRARGALRSLSSRGAAL